MPLTLILFIGRVGSQYVPVFLDHWIISECFVEG